MKPRAAARCASLLALAVLALARRLRHACRPAARPAPRPRPGRPAGRAGTARSSPSTRRSTTRCSSPVAEAYRDVVPAARAHRRRQLLRQHRRRLVGRQPPAAGQAARQRLEMGMRVVANTLFGLGGLLDPATEMRLDAPQRGLRPDAGPLGRAGPARTSCCRCWGRRRCATPPACRSTARSSPSRLSRHEAGALRASLAMELVDTRANLLATTAAARRRGAGQIRLRPRRLPGAPAATRSTTARRRWRLEDDATTSRRTPPTPREPR
ncbi:MAG: hypothetical protein MZW92_63230 [Comamonadaceae bacterium]|nr:hypothetical protein [Comamonadaceae bacterium]